MDTIETRAGDVLSELATINHEHYRNKSSECLSELATIKDGHYRYKSRGCFKWTAYN